MILLALNAHAGDFQYALKNLELAQKLDGRQDAHVLVCSDDKAVLDQICEAAARAFTQVRRFQYDYWNGDRYWPVVQNNAWQVVARWIEVNGEHYGNPSGWLWWESDAVPLRSGWLKTITEAHEKGGKPFSGHWLSDTTTAQGYQNGVGIWPIQVSNYLANSGALLARALPFDRVAGNAVRGNHTKLNHLMLHEVKPFGGSIGHAFMDRSEVDALLKNNPQAVFFHGCADGSLTRLLLSETLTSLADRHTLQTGGDQKSPSATPRFSISILCHNNVDFTRRCLASVLLHSGDDYELIVTDNGSTDGTAEYLQKVKARLGEWMQIISNHENLGFIDPSNTALRLARGEFVVLLNNDMECCSDWLHHLSKPLDNNSVGLVGLSGTCQSISKAFGGQPGGKAEYIEGSCLMGRTAQLREFGLFSNYLSFAYYEDVDLSLRLREAGYEIATVTLPMKHFARGSTSKLVNQDMLKRHVAHNKEAMFKRWGTYVSTGKFTAPKSVCLHRKGAHGDVLLLTPILRELHHRWPEAKLFVETDVPQVLAGLPHVTATREKVKADVRFELDMTYESDPSKHLVQVYADSVGVHLPDDWKVETASNHIGDFGNTVIFHRGPNTWISKLWPQDRWMSLGMEFRKRDYDVRIVPEGEKLPQAQLAGLIQSAVLFVGIDSYPAHLAQAVGTPAIVLFGSTNPKCILHPTANVIAVQGDSKKTPCIGSHGRRTKPLTQAPPCRGECMAAITVEMVMEAFNKLILRTQEVAA